MKRKIAFTAPAGDELSISLEENMATFKIGYCETGAFTKEELQDIKDCIDQMISAMDNS